MGSEQGSEQGIEAPDTLLGQLQRGLGRGYLAAVRGRRGSEELLTCIAHDPRWDRQIEERAPYYGRLAIELALPAEPIAAAVSRGEPERGLGSLAADVLAEMAVRGRDDALGALRQELHGSAWLLSLEALWDAEAEHGEVLLRREDLSAVAGHAPDELRRAFVDSGLPWRRWAAREPGLLWLLEDTSAARASTRGPAAGRLSTIRPSTTMSTSHLLSIAEPRNGVKVARILSERRDAASVAALLRAAQGEDRDPRLAAYRALGAQGSSVLLESVCTLLEDDPGGPSRGSPRSAMLRYLESLPADLTLPRARTWLGKGGGAAIAAEHILARHARPADRELVEESLLAALDEGAIHRACSMVQALATIAEPRSAEVLVSAFERSPYSWARPRVLRALAASGSEAAAQLAHEALWDCDEEARELGAQLTKLDESSRDRLGQIAEDRLERECVRAAAQMRLRWADHPRIDDRDGDLNRLS